MNIISLSQCWFEDTIGGSFFLASEQARALADQGHHLFFICCGLHEEDKLTIETEDGIEVWRYPKPAETASGFHKLKHHLKWSQKSVAKLFAQDKIDYAIGNTPLQSLGFLQERENQTIPFCYQVHSPFPDELKAQQRKSSISERIKIVVAKRIEKKIVRKSDVIVGSSQFTQSRLVSLYGNSILKKFRLVPGMVDVENFHSSTNRNELRNTMSLEWQTDKTIFFTLRRLEHRMGIEDLIKAAVILKKKNDQFRILIGGSGSMKTELTSLVSQLGLEDVISFLGRIPDDSLASSYSTADCFVLPTRAMECFGLIVLEAFACDTPVIGSDAGAIPELVGQQKGNWSFPSGNAEVLANRMQQFLSGELIADDSLREIAEKYSYEKMMPLWCEGIVENQSKPTHV